MEVFAAKSEDLNLIPKTHIVGENQLPQVPLTVIHVLRRIHTHTYTRVHTHTLNK